MGDNADPFNGSFYTDPKYTNPKYTTLTPNTPNTLLTPNTLTPNVLTNAIESVNARLRKIIKTRGHFPSDEAATKLIWLALRNITVDWGRTANHWKTAMNQFAILYEDRFTQGVV